MRLFNLASHEIHACRASEKKRNQAWRTIPKLRTLTKFSATQSSFAPYKRTDGIKEEILSDTIVLRTYEASKGIKQDSLLLKLPGELRNIIYIFVAAAEAKLHIKARDRLAIFNICRQICSEFKDIYYSDRIMKAEVWNSKAHCWKKIEDREDLDDILRRKDAYLWRKGKDEAKLRLEAKSPFKDPARSGILTLAHDHPGRARRLDLGDKFRQLW